MKAIWALRDEVSSAIVSKLRNDGKKISKVLTNSIQNSILLVCILRIHNDAIASVVNVEIV